jgi:hypothetical protein
LLHLESMPEAIIIEFILTCELDILIIMFVLVTM